MIKNVLFDFDGVILDSMPIRAYGFKKILEEFDDKLVEKLLDYHNVNGGLSRYLKIRYFFEEILNKDISEDKILVFAEKFSVIMKQELVNKKYLIADTLEFISKNFEYYNLHIVSGSDEKELKYLCKELNIDKYFKSISGSPIHKNNLVKNVLQSYKYKTNESILIGDSINDFEAARVNGIKFYGYNNKELISKGNYIHSFSEFTTKR